VIIVRKNIDKMSNCDKALMEVDSRYKITIHCATCGYSGCMGKVVGFMGSGRKVTKIVKVGPNKKWDIPEAMLNKDYILTTCLLKCPICDSDDLNKV
jgi:hypothetical protein